MNLKSKSQIEQLHKYRSMEVIKWECMKLNTLFKHNDTIIGEASNIGQARELAVEHFNDSEQFSMPGHE